MKQRIKLLLQIAVTLLAAGGTGYTIYDAIGDARPVEATESGGAPATASDLRRALKTQRAGELFVAVTTDNLTDPDFPPATAGDRVLGARNGSTMEIAAQEGGPGYSYRFTCSDATITVGQNDWRLCKAYTIGYIADAWRDMAAETGGVQVWGARKDVTPTCLANATPGQCLALLGGLENCWRETATGDLCRYGYSPTPDANGDPVACSPSAGWEWWPCVVRSGESPESRVAADAPTENTGGTGGGGG